MLPVEGDPRDNSETAARRPLFGRLRQALKRTRGGLVDRLSELFRGRGSIDAGAIEEIETLLIMADVGVDATDRIISDLTTRLARRQLSNPDAVFSALRENMTAILEPVSQPLCVPDQRDRPFVILAVGVNGTGKTTTIGKLAQRFQAERFGVMLAAGDTFRAAAVEQLQVWGERLGIPVVGQQPGADSASVIYDALQSAQARGLEVLIADTAGRLHTKTNLMEELKKVTRVLGKLDANAPHEILLVVDGGTGQNALAQAREFHQAVGVSGIAITKLDGTAKGGIVFAIAQQLEIPLRFIGVGEGPEDLRPFDAGEFVDALLAS